MLNRFSRTTRLYIAITISILFFITEISIGFKTLSIALIADAFHYLNDLIGYIVALTAILISDKSQTHKDLTFGWQRAQILGAFFNGAFLLALGVSIFLSSLERFVDLRHMKDPMLVVIVGAIGLLLNLTCLFLLHEQDHHQLRDYKDTSIVKDQILNQNHCFDEPSSANSKTPNPPCQGTTNASSLENGSETQLSIFSSDKTEDHFNHRHQTSKKKQIHHHDYGMSGVILHTAGDAINNIGVIIAGLIIWKTTHPKRFYADPTVGLFIALFIIVTSLPLVKQTGHILLQSPPLGIDTDDIKHDLESIPGIASIHELHVWRLTQHKAIASVHILVDDPGVLAFQMRARVVAECLHAYGVHSVTIQPELRRRSQMLETRRVESGESGGNGEGAEGAANGGNAESGGSGGAVARSEPDAEGTRDLCQLRCAEACGKMMCCG